MYPVFQSYLPKIKQLSSCHSLTKKDLLTDAFLMEKDGHLEMYYAPHNEYINTEANIVIVGITPGWNQMKKAFEQLLQSLNEQIDINQILKEVKKAASFSGTIRTNLTAMLDECGIHKVMGVHNSLSLFKEHRALLHTTSIIKYPVFYGTKNYTGHHPNIEQSSLLQHYAYQEFTKEMKQINKNALIIPLGKTVDQVLYKLEKEGEMESYFHLHGFPHPSGANGHRKRQFMEQKASLISTIKEWSQFQH